MQNRRMARRRRKPDTSKNRKLDEFLTNLRIDEPKKERILEFVERLTFESLKAASTKDTKQGLRLRLRR